MTARTYLRLTGRTKAAAPGGTAVRWGLAVLGYGFMAALLVVGVGSGQWPIPGGDVQIYLDAGERLRSGADVYVAGASWTAAMYYAPPIAVLFAAASLLPGWVLWALLVALDVAGLRYLAGSWMRVGWLAICPITTFQLVSGNPNFAIIAALLFAHRSHAGPLAWAAMAKLGPAIGLPLHRWREFAVGGLVGVALTIPWLGLWPDWIAFLLDAPAHRDPSGWPTVLPLLWRIPVIVALLALRRPWASMLAGALAIPGFYLVTAWATMVLAFRLALDRSQPTQ